VIQPTDIHTITEFRRSASLSSAIAADKRPHVLTEDGKPRLVVQDAAAYQETMAALERLEARAQIHSGLESMRRGEGRPAEEALAELGARLGVDPNA
jgi:PHD/YefM family antitoxin component YafN of YafNO toxin-antitoxin module